ncbi:hypothetical protein GGS23DRAFT_516098 [Durotheca rogersii]|uniref:uncharacterized protein n=1 Tax=Durotheca rogersii TaxID=419775 RepID=UPI002220272D|nr:uncharacterized protein GGS23DRAFT_516098 [Durotheca rogersii]KAI5863834.1 hypothetical protein GGS23DRAFT_516098 [Durotheca rogersii]
MDRGNYDVPRNGPLKGLFYHIVLPTKLPHGSDSNVAEIERALVDRLISAANTIRDIQDDTCWRAWDSIRRSLVLCRTLNIGGRVERSQLASHLKLVVNSDLVILRIATQNAGITIHRSDRPEYKDGVLFEFFEASPLRDAVLASQTLSWSFPGTAVLVPSSVFYDDAFLESLTGFLEQASVESTQKFSEYVTKAGHALVEDRETPDPSLITSLLAAILEGNGRRVSPELLQKRVRDDVCWFDTGSPWRRLPYWLVLRVAISRYLAATLGVSHGRIQYKFFMCIVHAVLLQDIGSRVDIEEQDFLKRKLCRRLYKLDREHLELPLSVQDSFSKLSRALTPQFNKIIQAITNKISTTWSNEMATATKLIPMLPRKARQEDLRLRLLLSREYLQRARDRFKRAELRRVPQTRTNPQQPKALVESFGNKLLKVFEKENRIYSSVGYQKTIDPTAQCRQLHDTIFDYINQVNDCYDENPEQKSIMALTLMEIWMALDSAACTLFPLLREFHPVFTPRLMEILRFPQFFHVLRARKVQSYIQERIDRCRGTRATIFDDPVRGCFAERYFDESPEAGVLAQLLARIQATAMQQRERKEEEWKELSAEYERLTMEFNSATCMFVQTADGLYPIHDNRSCRKCQLDKRRSSMVIRAFEWPLPESPLMAKAVVFELRCPEAFSAYRDATWAILSRVARENRESGIEPRLCLRDYSELRLYCDIHGTVSLASTTKSFLMTHYKERKRFPVDLDQVCLPNGLKLAYFDQSTSSWPGRKEIRPTFEHYCKLVLPTDSPFSSLLESRSFHVYGDGPSSYEIAASYSSCPTGVNPHEYMAFQFLLSGKRRRWISVLTELGSSNLNLSTETTVLLFDHISHQIGPSEAHEYPLGSIHYTFRDISFCKSLSEQLIAKLDVIASNWRETHLMEVILIVALRLVSFTWLYTEMKEVTAGALNILSRVRQITLEWVRMLRKEMFHAKGLNNAQNCQAYLRWAALLCKRTYAHQMTTNRDLTRAELSTFIECSAAVYDNLPDNIAALGRIVRNSFVRDLRMMFDLKDYIRQKINRDRGDAILDALREVWPASESKSIASITFTDESWVEISLEDSVGDVEIVNYNFVFGTLLINGEPLDRLPTDPKSTIVLEELFGSQTSLMKYPSKSPGMTHVLPFQKEGFHIHIGYDAETTIIRAIRGSVTLEFVPRDIFRRNNSFDLPTELIDNCIHWLDLRTGILEIRPKSKNHWRSHPHNWKLDLARSTCWRSTPRHQMETLVDPYCPLFGRVSKIFDWFEPRQHLTVYQPPGKFSLTIDLPRMQLRWFVNPNQFLQSSHLQAEIDPDQQIGTWYGFDSKLVCRSLRNPQERFVLVPVGNIKARTRGSHVQVCVHPEDSPSAIYVRFTVNQTLGRIDCAAEPALVYRKAEIHAFTSFVLPDPLTGLTGFESSLAILTSGMAQPWSPLGMIPIGTLMSIATLAPRREYYPEDRKTMKKEFWEHVYPANIQREELRILVDQIISRSTKLASFHPQVNKPPQFPSPGDAHLNLRAIRRRQLYQRSSGYELQLETPSDMVYQARHCPPNSSLRYLNVLETVSIIRDKPAFMSTTDNLASSLSQSLAIKGYVQQLEKTALGDRLGVDVRREWGPLVKEIKEIRGKYKLMFFMGVVSFRSDANTPLIRTLIAFAQWDRLQSLDLPSFPEYSNFQPRQTPQLNVLIKLIQAFKAPPPEDPPLSEFSSGRDQRKYMQARLTHAKKADEDCRDFAQALLQEWPCPYPMAKYVSDSCMMDVLGALEILRPEWERLYRNHEFYVHLQEVQKILNERHSDVKYQRPEFVPSESTFPVLKPECRIPELGNDLMRIPCRKVSASIAKENADLRQWKTRPKAPSPNVAAERTSRELEHIIGSFVRSKSTVKQKYANDLKESLAAFNARGSQDVPDSPPTERQIAHLEEDVQRCFREIKTALERPSDWLSKHQIDWLQKGQLWPAVTRVTVLEQLRSTANRDFGSGMKDAILSLALSITSLQKQIRMDSYQRLNEITRYEEERLNIGHRNWRVEDYPEWLLLEVESNLLIRETQVEVALAIVSPESGASSVLQLNMGQGKTSCIIPMVAVLLADGKSLVRVSVPKALLQQTAQLLHGRLGGLVGREIGHVPFSRRTPTHEDHIKLFQRLHRDIQKKRGIMLCLPEHQMSFMLSGLQRVLDKRIPEASMMVRVQRWLQSCARDVLDECDHTLAVKTQLIYPSGSQMAVDGHPNRWLIAEQILGLVDMHLHNLAIGFPQSIEVVRRFHGRYPFVFFLRPDVEEELIKRLRIDVCRGVRGILPVDTLEPADRIAIKEFLSSGKVRQSSIDRITRLCPDRPHIRQSVYILRGLLVHRILLMVLKKRYGVQYGLHPHRHPVAVPFHAKGVPSEQSEFGHVDVAILLTALAFYYRGISVPQARQALEAVLKSDDPASEYDKWTEDENFPDYLRDWHSINVDDTHQMNQIWHFVHFKVPVIDYYMNNFVFPIHAKQFKVRLQSNGWDIPLFSGSQPNQPTKWLNKTRGVTTGFSGTNDIKPLLPLTITQDDLPSLSHTNAEVLTYLLQPRSRKYVVMADQYRKRLTENEFLYMLRKHNIRILIDSGAQILEHSNLELARSWLKVDPKANAALFFDGDKPYIISKVNTKTPLLASPYADNLEGVLVYLDEAHTRGTDLKFGPNACAALTLGLGQTKDHTVQAAMRLRQLGTTQSVVFFAPPEVNQSIRDLCAKKDNEWISSRDVIHWLINNTCDGIEQLQPLYYSQGVDFCNRMQAIDEFPDFLTDDDQRAGFIDAIKHTERQTLQKLYGPQTKAKASSVTRWNPKIAEFVEKLEMRRKNFQDTGQAVHPSALQEVEQERETEFEVETVRQVKKPMPYTPYSFPGLHRDLETFARTGRIPAGSDIFVHALKALSRTFLGKKYKVNPEVASSQLFISREFERTVKLVIESANDNFLRPVQWILHTESPETAVIVTPEEAEGLIRIIRDENKHKGESPTRLLTYAAPVTRRMMHFNKLDFYTIPPISSDWRPAGWLTTELGFFAGRLYFEWAEYEGICSLLGIDVSAPSNMVDELDSSETETTTGQEEASDSRGLVIHPDTQGTRQCEEPKNTSGSAVPMPGTKAKGLTLKPYTFTQEYLAVRRRGQDFAHTPMGFICTGKPLTADSPLFRRADEARRTQGFAPVMTADEDNDDRVVIEETMDVGEYDPSAEVKDDEEHVEIEYDESDKFREDDDYSDDSGIATKPEGRTRKVRTAKFRG